MIEKKKEREITKMRNKAEKKQNGIGKEINWNGGEASKWNSKDGKGNEK